jgi:hypothetical protein
LPTEIVFDRIAALALEQRDEDVEQPGILRAGRRREDDRAARRLRGDRQRDEHEKKTHDASGERAHEGLLGQAPARPRTERICLSSKSRRPPRDGEAVASCVC